jgi:hypothetical protein
MHKTILMGYNFKPVCDLTLYTVKSQGVLHLYYLQHAKLVLNLIATEIIYNLASNPPPLPKSGKISKNRDTVVRRNTH